MHGVMALLRAPVAVILLGVSVEAQTNTQRTSLTVCEDAYVSLQQTKQEVRSALAVCCRLAYADFPSGTIKDISGPAQDLNQIDFEAKEVGGTCSGTVMFNNAEKLVFAKRQLAIVEGNSPALALGQAIEKGLDALLPGRPAIDVKEGSA